MQALKASSVPDNVRVRNCNFLADGGASDDTFRVYGSGVALTSVSTVSAGATTVTATGARVPEWTTVDTVFASIQPASSDDRAPFERRGVFVSHKVFIAEDPGVTEGDRIGRGVTVKYMIHGVKNVMDRGELWVLYCEEMKA